MKSVSKSKKNGIETLRVGEIMIPLEKYPHLPDSASVLEAIEIMHHSEIEIQGRKSLPRTILLFGLNDSISGIVRRRDLMQGLEPKFLVSKPLEYRMKLFDVEVDSHLSELPFDRIVHGIEEQVNRPVADIMHPVERTINFDEHIMTAVYEMVSKNLSILPVVQNNKVVGIIRTVDIFHELAELVLND